MLDPKKMTGTGGALTDEAIRTLSVVVLRMCATRGENISSIAADGREIAT